MAAGLPVLDVGQRGGGEASAAGADTHLDDLARAGEWQGAQKNLIDDGEHGRVDADGKSEREDGHEGKDRRVS